MVNHAAQCGPHQPESVHLCTRWLRRRAAAPDRGCRKRGSAPHLRQQHRDHRLLPRVSGSLETSLSPRGVAASQPVAEHPPLVSSCRHRHPHCCRHHQRGQRWPARRHVCVRPPRSLQRHLRVPRHRALARASRVAGPTVRRRRRAGGTLKVHVHPRRRDVGTRGDCVGDQSLRQAPGHALRRVHHHCWGGRGSDHPLGTAARRSARSCPRHPASGPARPSASGGLAVARTGHGPVERGGTRPRGAGRGGDRRSSRRTAWFRLRRHRGCARSRDTDHGDPR